MMSAWYTRLERLSWEAYSEADDLSTICERYRERTGHYPEAVLADKLFRNRKNLRYCAERGIRLSGPRLGRPPKERDPELLKQELADNSARNAIEGKFGQCKRRLRMNRVMAKRRDCSETVIAITILTANLIRWMQEPQWLLLPLIPIPIFRVEISENSSKYQKTA
ncbi:MAG: transposase [Victivallaceae bacterium]|nr:transposase [Victivallaceae bacterium]